MELGKIQPSQLYINSEKLSLIVKECDPIRVETLSPIPVKKLRNDIVSTDGHTRAFAACLNGLSEVRVFWDEDEMDWEAYEICVEECKKRGIYKIADLRDKVVSDEDYQLLWRGWCDAMHEELDKKRRRAKDGHDQKICSH
jgi:hypothetical protein